MEQKESRSRKDMKIVDFFSDVLSGTVKCETCGKEMFFIGSKSSGERAFRICDHKDLAKPK